MCSQPADQVHTVVSVEELYEPVGRPIEKTAAETQLVKWFLHILIL